MNVIFSAVFLLSALALFVLSPESFLSALLNGAESSFKTAFTLLCVYAVWMGLSAVAEDAGLDRKLSRLALPLCRKLFRTRNERAADSIAMNLTCNLIGIGGAATPYAVKAIGRLEEDGNDFAQKLLFIVNATSIQLFPTTVVALRAAAGSASAADIALPSLLASAVSTALAVAAFCCYDRVKRRKGRRARRGRK